MASSSSLTEKLATLGINLPACPEEPEGGGTTGDWIQRGHAYAAGLRLWRAQLRNAPETTKGELDQMVRHLHDTSEVETWEKLVYSVISPEGCDSTNLEYWQSLGKLIQSSALTVAQLLGIALEMAREQQLEAAMGAIRRIFNENPRINKEEQLHLVLELVAAMNFTQLIDDARSSQEDLDRAIGIHKQMVTLVSAAFSQHVSISEGTRDSDVGVLSRKLDVIVESQRQPPEEVDKLAWGELLKNASSTADPRLPDLLLIESRSLPRSGHHFLQRILAKAAGKNFSYCEGYQEPGCCKKSPCGVMSYWRHARANHVPHLRLVKSHDFLLKDPTLPLVTGMIRLIQIRKPFDLLASWLELKQLSSNKELLAEKNISLERIMLYHEKQLIEDAWQLIDRRGSVMTKAEAENWLQEKSIYIRAFLKKWIPQAMPFPFGESVSRGTLLLCYEDLDRGPEILESLGFKVDKIEEVPRFHRRNADTTLRQSALITDLIRSQADLLKAIDAKIMETFPSLIDII